MTRRNGSASSLPRRRTADPMGSYDRLPAPLRAWLARAALPWRPASVARAYRNALARAGDRDAALAELDRMEAALLRRDAASVWGAAHPVRGGDGMEGFSG